jgi:hypothetical protein
MPSPNFASRLNATLSTTGSEPYLTAFTSLEQMAAMLQQWLSSAPATTPPQVQVEPGFPATIGQQFNVVVRIPGRDVADTLFRAYIAPSGQVSLDFFGDEPVVCQNESDIENQVLDFLARPEVKSRLAVYQRLAA